MATTNPIPSPPVSLDDKVAFLSDASSYPWPVKAVEARETHMSWVFLTDHDVLKLKKPVFYPPLDFRSIPDREHNCREEVRLGRRLAPDVYLRVERLTCSPRGELALNGQGEAIDWLVHMRRLPEDRMLDAVIIRKQLSRKAVDALVGVLGRFYTGLEPVVRGSETHLDRFASRHAMSVSTLNRYRHLLDSVRIDEATDRVADILEQDPELVSARMQDQPVVEGHGDLRAQHVCLTHPPLIIDSLEFDRDLRLVDPFEEAAFLGLDCARLGADWVASHLKSGLEKMLPNHPTDRLFDLYTVYHACVRARIAIAHLDDDKPATPEIWPSAAMAYIKAAAPAIARLKP